MSFKSDIKNIQRALLKIPGLSVSYGDEVKFLPSVGGRSVAYFSVNVDADDFWAGIVEPRGGVAGDKILRPAWKQYQTLVDRRARDVREVLNVTSEYKFRNLTPKIAQVQKTMVNPEHYRRLDYFLLPDDLAFDFDIAPTGKIIKRSLLFGMQDVPVLGMTMNWYIMPDWYYDDHCAKFYFEFSMQASAKKPKAFKTFPEIQAGSLFACSYGYDATIWEFYEVVERQSESYLVVRVVNKKVRDSGVVTSRQVYPIAGDYADNKLYRVKLATTMGKPCFKAPVGHYALPFRGDWYEETDPRFI